MYVLLLMSSVLPLKMLTYITAFVSAKLKHCELLHHAVINVTLILSILDKHLYQTVIT